ncbi:MAG TPA: sialate O-acetylesterase, partial [Luteolibacter sp.]|nr:sialate O-acetylesterase [Luteolibacter sp.]
AGQKKSATAGKDGKWMLELDPLKASYEPAEMKIAEQGGKSVTLKNLLVGEVWFASGQSNMVWPANKCDVGLLQKQIDERVAAGKEKQPVIREAKVTDYFAALHPVEHANAVWHAEAGEMSGVAYAFAYHVFKEVDVPVGILNCSFSQTSIQAWTPRIGYRDGKDEYTKAIYQKILETDPTTPEHKAAWDKFYADAEAAVKAGKAISTKTPGNMGDNRDASWLFNARLNPMIPYACRGGIWNQGWASIGEGIVYYNNLHSMIRGWRLAWGRPEMPVYFNQFYSNGVSETPTIGTAADMRFGTWLARDIPHTGMGIQIDIGGAIHYSNKTLSGQRLALHALKNEYGKQVVADGPMFKSCKVEGDKLIIELDHAEGGLVVAETNTNSKAGLAVPTVIPDGASQVKLFYLAGEDRVWYPADVKIDGSKLLVSSAKVKAPRGVSYGSGGIGGKPNIYNQALLPLTPFTYYDNEFVTAANWKGDFKVDGVEPALTGIVDECRKMPLLSTQFVNNAVLQADQPVTIWGAALPWAPWSDKPASGKAEVKFSFAGVEKTIPVTPGMKEWQVTLPPQKASAEPKTLKVSFVVDGVLAHERVVSNIVFGDVWYVAAPFGNFDVPAAKSGGLVRVMTRASKGDRSERPRPYTISTSTTPDNRFASVWKDADGFAAALGQAIAAKTGKPVGIIFMQSAGGKDTEQAALKHWIAAEDLGRAPSLKEDYDQLASMIPGTKPYEANVQRYLNEWKKYWGEYIPALITTKAVPDGKGWGSYPDLAGLVKTDASQVYNVMVDSFTPANFKGIIFMSGKPMVEADQGAHFGEQLAALANSWKERFACPDPVFLYTIPSASLAPKITKPADIKGRSIALEINNWPIEKAGKKDAKPTDDPVPAAVIEKVLGEVYK